MSGDVGVVVPVHLALLASLDVFLGMVRKRAWLYVDQSVVMNGCDNAGVVSRVTNVEKRRKL